VNTKLCVKKPYVCENKFLHSQMVLRLFCSLFTALKVTSTKSDEVMVKNDQKNGLKEVIMTYMEKPFTLKIKYKKTIKIFRIVDSLTKIQNGYLSNIN
jgi:hypothetical protein